jgi:hypothetical protein
MSGKDRRDEEKARQLEASKLKLLQALPPRETMTTEEKLQADLLQCEQQLNGLNQQQALQEKQKRDIETQLEENERARQRVFGIFQYLTTLSKEEKKVPAPPEEPKDAGTQS